jgi:hypothetical protein
MTRHASVESRDWGFGIRKSDEPRGFNRILNPESPIPAYSPNASRMNSGWASAPLWISAL